MVSTSRCGRENPGSNPGHGKVGLCTCTQTKAQNRTKQTTAVHNFVMALFLFNNIVFCIYNNIFEYIKNTK